jgi:1-deoxyxylulose-5-phosphate synthase
VSAPIVGPTKPGHLADAVAALGIRLTDDEAQRLEAPYTPRSLLNWAVWPVSLGCCYT